MPALSLQRSIRHNIAGVTTVCKAHAITDFVMSRSFNGGYTRLTALSSTHQVEIGPIAGENERRRRVRIRFPVRRPCHDWDLRIYLASIAHWAFRLGSNSRHAVHIDASCSFQREGQCFRGERREQCRQAIAHDLRASA